MSLRILILVPYYNRPLLLRNAVRSILRAHAYYPHWEMVLGDDGSHIPGRPVVEEVLNDYLDRVTFLFNDMSVESKLEKGLVMGEIANRAVASSTADVAIILCDDDELVPTYLRDLAEFFVSHPDVLYCYSKVHIFNPFLQKSEEVNNVSGKYNQWEGPINPAGKLDSSQVAWRMSCVREYGARFANTTKLIPGKPWVVDTDKSFFESLFEKCGPCYPTGFVAQYKGIHDYQLLWHKNASVESILEYDKMIREFGGVRF